MDNQTGNNNEVVSQEQNYQKPSSKKSIPWLILLLVGGLIVGLTLFLGYKFYLTPLQIKEKAVYLKELFSDYTKTVNKIIDYMTEDSSSDFSSETIKRQCEKGRLILKEYQEISPKIKKQIEKTKINEMNSFISELNNYLKETEKLYQLTEESVKWGEAFYPIYKDYETSSLEVQGVSNYLYYDPDKYVKTLEEFLEKDKKIIDGVKKIKTTEFKEINNLMAEKLEIEYKLIEDLISAVNSRTISKIAEAEKEYSKNTIEINKKLGAETEKINDRIKEMSREIKSINEKVDEEYTQLRNRYRF